MNTMARTLGYRIVDAENGRVVVAACPSEEHLNPEGDVHGGLAATLLDTCMGLAVRSTLQKGVAATTLGSKVSLLRGARRRPGARGGHRAQPWWPRRHCRRAADRPWRAPAPTRHRHVSGL